MTHAHPRTPARWWAVAICAALLAALAALLPARAQAAISKPTSSYYQLNGTAPVSGLKLTGYDGKTVYVAVQVSGLATVSVPTAAQAGLSLPFGYASWSGSQIAFTGPVANANAALAALTVVAGNVPFVKNSTVNDVTLNLTAFDNGTGAAYNPANQHFYRFVGTKVAWSDASGVNRLPLSGSPSTRQTATKGANTLAGESVVLGQTGYLATITDAEENAFIASKIQGADGTVVKNVWIGGNDITTEGKFVWAGGPEKDLQFWQGLNDGSPFEGRYANWAAGEPNNCTYSQQSGCSPTTPHAEDCVVMNRYVNTGDVVDGTWNDLPCSFTGSGASGISGYVIEYGNKAVGGDYSGVDTLAATLKARPFAPKVKANFFDKVFSLLFTSKKRKNLPKKPNKPATFTFKTKVKMVNPGTYVVSIKRKDGQGVPYMLLPGTKAQAAGGKAVTLGSTRWSIEVTTTKANQTVTVDPVLKTMDWVKPAGTSLSVKLKTDSNMRCPLGWCESTPIPSPREQGRG